MIEQSHLPAKQTLDRLGIPRSTFYLWYDKYQTGGVDGEPNKNIPSSIGAGGKPGSSPGTNTPAATGSPAPNGDEDPEDDGEEGDDNFSDENGLGEGDTVTTRTTRAGDKGARITRKDGSVIDITPTRVKEFTPNTNSQAPPGTLQRVKFPNALPGSKGFKRAPTVQELRLLEGL